MPKVLFVNCSCFGSTGKIVNDIADYAAGEGYDSVLCAPLGDGKNDNIKYYKTSVALEQGVYRRIKYYTGYQYGFAPISTAKIKRIVKKESPDVVHLHCLNGDMVNIYSLFEFLKKNNIKTVITNHAEFYYTGSCVYSYDCVKWKEGCGNCPMRREATRSHFRDTSATAWKRMQKAFDGFNAVMVSVSPFVSGRASESPITSQMDQRTVLNGINTDTFSICDTSELRKKHNIDEKTRVLFHVTSHFSNHEGDIKGGEYLIDLAQRLENDNVVIFVAGNKEVDFEVPSNMILLGRLADQKVLASYYAMADITVLTSRKETFSMPVAESLCCGTPVVGFEAGGPESIALSEYCEFVEYADVDALLEAVTAMLDKKLDKENISRAAALRYDSKIMAKQYVEIYNELIGS